MTQAYNLSQFANFLNTSGQVSASGIQSGVVVGSGTVMLFYQAAAPTGWTQVTTLNDYDLRLVSGAGGTTGGTTAYSTVFANQTPTFTGSIGTLAGGATTLSTAQIPSHNHSLNVDNTASDGTVLYGAAIFASLVNGTICGGGMGRTSINANIGNSNLIAANGSGGSHSHSISGTPGGTVGAVTLNVRYANIIICSKN